MARESCAIEHSEWKQAALLLRGCDNHIRAYIAETELTEIEPLTKSTAYRQTTN